MKLKISIQKQKIKFSELNEIETDLAKLVGLLLTDGGVSKVSGRWRIHFTSNSETLIQEFRNLVQRLYGYKLSTEKRFGATSVRAWINKDIAKELLSLTPSYRTLAYSKDIYPEAVIPKFILNNKEYAKVFLRYAYTGDGSVIFYIGKAKYGFRFDRMLAIYCEHPELRKQYYGVLKTVGFEPRLYKNYVSLRGLGNLQKFEQEVGFVENVQITGNGKWNGFAKSDLLRLCIKSFKFKPSKLGNSEKEIYANLLKILASDTGDRSI